MLSFINNTYELSSLINTLFALTIKFEYLKQILEDLRKNENFEKNFKFRRNFWMSKKRPKISIWPQNRGFGG